MTGSTPAVGTAEQRSFGPIPAGALVLALAPALAASSLVVNAVILSIAVAITLIGSRLMYDAAQRWIPGHLEAAAYLLIATVLVTLLDILRRRYLAAGSSDLDLALPMMIVSSLILHQRTPWQRTEKVLADTAAVAAQFAVWLIGVSLIREVIGNGTVTLFPIGGFGGVVTLPVLSDHPVRMFARAPGAFLVLGYLLAVRTGAASRLRAEREDVKPDGRSTRAES